MYDFKFMSMLFLYLNYPDRGYSFADNIGSNHWIREKTYEVESYEKIIENWTFFPFSNTFAAF